MNIVVLADDAFSFLVAWEFMSLTSGAMVVSNHKDPENLRAGYVYLLMASFGTLVLLLAFGVLAGGTGAYDFAAIRAAHETRAVAGAVLLLALLGAGSKAGLVPLHAWLPLAHPAAPSHVSGLMSGVMTKVAVYGFVRIVFDLLGAPEWWWSMVLLAIGGPTATLGVLYALMQRDIKRVLAYSTIEISASSSPASGSRSRSRPRGAISSRRSPSPRRCCTCSTMPCSRACCFSAQAAYSPRPANATWRNWAG